MIRLAPALLVTLLACEHQTDTGRADERADDTAQEDTSAPETEVIDTVCDLGPVGTLVTATWTGDKDVIDLIDFWSMDGTMTDCSGCLYAFDADFQGQKTGASFSRSVLIEPIEGYPGYGYTYADEDFWGIAFDYYDYVIVSNYGVYLQSGTAYAPYLYQGYFYFYE